MDRKVRKIIYNWFATEECGEEYYIDEVGKRTVTKIEEYRPKGEGDKWFYDIYFEDGSIERIFNPNKVIYFPRNELGGEQ